MPYRTLDLTAAADYLHVARSELEQLVKTSDPLAHGQSEFAHAGLVEAPRAASPGAG